MNNLLNYRDTENKEAINLSDNKVSVRNVAKVFGYLLALHDIMRYVEDVTKMRPENRYIDAVELMKAVHHTSLYLLDKNDKWTQIIESWAKRHNVDLTKTTVDEIINKILSEDENNSDQTTS